MCTTECKLQKKGPSSAEWNEIEQDYLCISLSIDHLFQQHTQLDNTRSRFLHALITITFQPPSQSRNQGTKSVSTTLGIILNTHFFKHHHLPSFLIFNSITPFFSAVVHSWLEEQVRRTPPSPCNGSACGSAAQHLHFQLHFHKHRQHSPKSLTSTPQCDSASSTFNIYTI